MKIRLEDITEEPTRKTFVGAADVVNARLAEGHEAVDFRLSRGLDVDVTYYRAGEDLYFHGTLDTSLEGTCARCLGTFGRALATPFEFVLAPSRESREPGDREELHADDLALSFYAGPEIDLEPLCSEQAILALPTRALCREDCRGLCPICGADRNTESCDCHVEEPDPRWSALREWKPRAS